MRLGVLMERIGKVVRRGWESEREKADEGS